MSIDPRTSVISIIIPARDEEARIGVTLAALREEPGVEVIVVDGESRDRTATVAADHGAMVLEAPTGRGSQMNLGARQAAGDILLFLHADTRLPPGFGSAVRKILCRPGVAAGAFRLAIDAPGRGFRLIERGANLRARYGQLPYGDQALFLPAARFQEVGGYPEQPLMEDVALVGRLRRCGRIALLPLAASTSARRWQRRGLVVTTLLNQLFLAAYLLGVRPERLAGWYR